MRTNPSCAASDEDGEAIPPIVIYCLSPDSAPRILAAVARIFSDVTPRSKTLMSYKTPPRYSAKVRLRFAKPFLILLLKIDPLIWWANGDGDAKRALVERIDSDETFAIVRDALYTEDMSAFKGRELELTKPKIEEEEKTKKSRGKTKK